MWLYQVYQNSLKTSKQFKDWHFVVVSFADPHLEWSWGGKSNKIEQLLVATTVLTLQLLFDWPLLQVSGSGVRVCLVVYAVFDGMTLLWRSESCVFGAGGWHNLLRPCDLPEALLKGPLEQRVAFVGLKNPPLWCNTCRWHRLGWSTMMTWSYTSPALRASWTQHYKWSDNRPSPRTGLCH